MGQMNLPILRPKHSALVSSCRCRCRCHESGWPALHPFRLSPAGKVFIQPSQRFPRATYTCRLPEDENVYFTRGNYWNAFMFPPAHSAGSTRQHPGCPGCSTSCRLVACTRRACMTGCMLAPFAMLRIMLAARRCTRAWCWRTSTPVTHIDAPDSQGRHLWHQTHFQIRIAYGSKRFPC
jgi:hypothetical protein